MNHRQAPDDRSRSRWVATANLAARDAMLAPLLGSLAKRGVRPVVIKGDALSRQLYGGDLENRPHSDSDWLVKPEQRALTVELLQLHGWTAVPECPDDFVRRGPVDVRVDLHTGLWFLPEKERSRFEARCHAVEDRPPLRYPDLTDHFVIVALHAVLGHGQLREVWRRDLERLRQAGVDLDRVRRTADRWGQSVAVKFVFDQLGIARETDFSRQHWFDRFRHELLGELVARSEVPDVGHVLRWLFTSQFDSRWRWVQRHLRPSDHFLRQRYRDESTTRSRRRRGLRSIHALGRVVTRLAGG